MDETIASIIRGCQLAKDLESNLPHLANQPNILSKSCDEIINIFINARERLNIAQELTASYLHMLYHEQHKYQPSQIHAGVQEWLRSTSTTQAPDVLQTQLLAEKSAFMSMRGLPEFKPSGELRLEVPVTELASRRDMEGPSRLRGSSEGVFQAVGASGSGRSSSSQRSRRRRDDSGRRRELVAAPSVGNTEIPPDDGFTWRKYGQKEILGTKFPRAYFRCTHQKLYQCPAKKLVQRLDNDPNTFEVTYRGDHTCHMSATAPSGAPPSVTIAQDLNQQQATATLQPPPPSTATSLPLSLSTWLSMEFRPTREGINPFMDSHQQMYRNFNLGGGSSSSSSSSMVGNDGAGPSTVRCRKELADYHPVLDMADVMFNSGSSSNNSMDFIFPSKEEKWDPDHDKKN